MLQRIFEHGLIAHTQCLEPGFETLLEPLEAVRLALTPCDARVTRAGRWGAPQQIHGQGRDQGARQEIRRQHREHDRFGKRREKVMSDAGKQQHRYEHDAYGQGRDQRRNRDFARSIEYRLQQGLTLFDMVGDVFDRDGGVVDQNTHCQREAAQRHDVDSLAEQGEHDQRGDHRQRDRDGDNQRGSPTAQEHQDHRGRQARCDQAFADHTLHGGFDEHRLVGDRFDVKRARHLCTDVRQHLLDLGDHVERRDVAALFDFEQGRPLSVMAHDVGLRRIPVAHVGYVVYVSHGPVGVGPDRQVVEFGHRFGAAVHVHVVFERADFGRTAGQYQVLGIHRIDHISWRQPMSLQRLRVDIDHDLAHLAAIGDRHRRALHGCQLGADEVIAQVVKRLFGQGLARQGKFHDRHCGRVVGQHQRWQRARRQHAQQALCAARRLGQCARDIGAGMEKDLHDGHAVERLRLDVFDVAHVRGQGPLIGGNDPMRNVFRRHAVIGPDDTEHGNVDVGKNIDGCAQYHQRPDDQQQQGQHDKGIRAAQSDFYDPHGAGSLFIGLDKKATGLQRVHRAVRGQSSERDRAPRCQEDYEFVIITVVRCRYHLSNRSRGKKGGSRCVS